MGYICHKETCAGRLSFVLHSVQCESQTWVQTWVQYGNNKRCEGLPQCSLDDQRYNVSD
jgi:hypothetical protein